MKISQLATLALATVAIAFASCGKDSGGDGPAPVKVTSITLNAATKSLEAGGTFQLSTTDVLPANATDKTVTWSSSNSAVATVDGTGLVTASASAADGATATITATANDGSGKKAICEVTVIQMAVSINGVAWAPYNVAAPGAFAATPEASGMFYQWNKNIGWSATNPMVNSNGGTTWDATAAAGTEWEAANDPCPAGWRVPTKAEQDKLFDAAKVTKSWTTLNSVNGYIFTDIASSKSIFLPAAGYRDYTIGTLLSVGSNGYYWSGSMYSGDSAWFMYFNSGDAGQGNNDRTYGFSVRCVRQ